MRLILSEGEKERGTPEHELALKMIPVFEEALLLAVERNKRYGDSWKSQGYMGNLSWILSKIARMKFLMWRDKDPEEDRVKTAAEVKEHMLDSMNYEVFFMINWREGNRWGNVPS